MTAIELITRNYLMYLILPLWLVPGVADWVFHRRSRIEATSGLKESLIHAVMMAEVGVAVLLGLFFDVTTLVILMMIIDFIAHYATAWWDVSYAVAHREVVPAEQHAHGVLEMLPFAAVSLVICLHFDQLAALFHGTADFGLRWKQPMLSPVYLVSILAAVGICIGLPYAEELWRCWRYQRRERGLPVGFAQPA